MAESEDSNSDLMISAVAMLALGIIMCIIGGWCSIGFIGAFQYETANQSTDPLANRENDWMMSTLFGSITLGGLGGGLWLIVCGARVLLKMVPRAPR